ncbi:hypothetical protein ABK040_000786 [Willaertia magna]
MQKQQGFGTATIILFLFSFLLIGNFIFSIKTNTKINNNNNNYNNNIKQLQKEQTTTTSFYGIPQGSPLQLISFNPFNLQTKPIGPILSFNELVGQQLSSIDIHNKIYYLLGFNSTNQMINLFGISLNTGLFTSITKVPILEGIFLGIGQSCNVDLNDGSVIVSGLSNNPANTGKEHVILRINPKSGEVKQLASLKAEEIIGGVSGYDYKNNVFWIEFGRTNNITKQLEVDLFAYDGLTGNLLKIVNNNLFMQTMAFDPILNKMIGIGLLVKGPNNYQRIIVSLDSINFKLEQLSVIEGDYVMLNGAIGLIDYYSKQLYCSMQSNNNQTNFDFLTIQYETGKIVRKVDTGSKYGLKVWSLEFDFN